MHTTQAIITLVSEILDLEPTEIQIKTYLIRDLHAESIDLLEIGVAIQHRLGIAVDDDQLFLKNMRMIISRAEKDGVLPLDALHVSYPHLSLERLQDIVHDLVLGPVVQVQDLIAYAHYALKVQP